MLDLGRLRDHGEILMDSQPQGTVRYDINVYEDEANLKDGHGHIFGNLDLLNLLHDKPSVELVLGGNAGTLAIYVRTLNVLDGSATIVTTGPIPGF